MIYNGTALMDSDGEIIEHFTQWDLNYPVFVDAGGLTNAPMFHFANSNSKNALGVQSELINGMFKVQVPNILLKESLPIDIWVYMIDTDMSKTILTFHVVVKSRLMPPDYAYEDDKPIDTVVARIDTLTTKHNYLLNQVGNTAELKTTNHIIVLSINELYDVLDSLINKNNKMLNDITTIYDQLGSISDLETSSKTIVGAINELKNVNSSSDSDSDVVMDTDEGSTSPTIPVG